MCPYHVPVVRYVEISAYALTHINYSYTVKILGLGEHSVLQSCDCYVNRLLKYTHICDVIKNTESANSNSKNFVKHVISLYCANILVPHQLLGIIKACEESSILPPFSSSFFLNLFINEGNFSFIYFFLSLESSLGYPYASDYKITVQSSRKKRPSLFINQIEIHSQMLKCMVTSARLLSVLNSYSLDPIIIGQLLIRVIPSP